MDFPILLERNATVPLQRQIYLEIRKAILAGHLAPGARVPSTRALAISLGISRTTATLAYEQLISEGYLTSARGSGMRVCALAPDRSHSLNSSPGERRHMNSAFPLSRYGQRLAETQVPLEPPLLHPYDFWPGCPSLEDFPMAAWTRILGRHARKRAHESLDYAPDPQGHGPLREAIADYLVRSRGVRCESSQVVIVSGTQQAIDLSLRLLVEPGASVAMEEPGYPAARQAIQAHGANILSLPVLSGGLDLDPLESPSGTQCRLVYVTPSHQFPLGTVMDPSRRLRLISWCQRHQAAVLEDDYDSEFRFRGRPLPALQGLDESGVVLYAGTFSKVLFPAIRIGYLVLPHPLVDLFTKAHWVTTRGTSSLIQHGLADFIREGHLERHIRRMRTVYAERWSALEESLRHHFGPRVEILGDEGGLHLSARIDTQMRDDQVLREAAKLGVVLPPMADQYLGESPGGWFLFGFSGLTPARIREGIRRLASLGL